MGTPRFTPEFKEEAVRQITERGDSVDLISKNMNLCLFTYHGRIKTERGIIVFWHARINIIAREQ